MNQRISHGFGPWLISVSLDAKSPLVTAAWLMAAVDFNPAPKAAGPPMKYEARSFFIVS